MTRTSNTRTRPARRLLALVLATLMVTSLFAGVAVAAAESENNDTRTNADPILSGGAGTETSTGSLTDGDVDYFSFTATRGQQVRITATRSTAETEGYIMRLYRGTSGLDSEFFSPGETNELGATILADDTYYVQIDGDSGSYSFDVELFEPSDTEPNDDRQDAVPISPAPGSPASASGALNVNDVDFFSFEAERGQQVRVTSSLSSSATEGYIMRLYRGTSGLDSEFFSPGETNELGATILANDTYYVQVDGDTGSYSFEVSITEPADREPNNDRADAVPINSTATVEGELFPQDVDFFAFDAIRGEQIRVTSSAPSAASEGYIIRIYQGTTGLDSEFFSPGETNTLGATVVANGTYYVQVDGDDGSYSFDVETRVFEATEPNDDRQDATPLFENPREPTLTGGLVTSDVDYFRLPVAVGDNVSVTATLPSSATSGYTVRLYRGTTGLDSEFISPGETSTVEASVDADAQYYLQLDGDETTYDLTVTVSGVVVGLANDRFELNENVSDAADPGFGQLTELRIVDDDVDVFAYDLDSGDTLTAQLTYSATGEALTLAVLDANGAVQTSADPADSDVPLEFVAPSDGTYYLRVTGDGDGTVPYTLAARVPTQVSVAFDPATATVTPGESTTVDVVVGGTNAGIGAYDFVVSVDNTSVATIESVQALGATAGTSVTVAPDGSSATVNVSAASLSGTGSLAIARVTLNASADGSTATSISAASVLDAAGFEYVVSTVDGEVVASTGPGVVVGNMPALDLDGDGLYEDVNGDGVSNLEDVFDLAFDVLPLVAQQPGLVPFFDFDGDGEVNLDDVFALAFS